jgi:sulfite exporter TauE/SafE
MSHGLELLGALCAPTPWAGSLMLGLLLAGLAGSTMHCVPMCGPFVLGQVGDRMARVPAARLCELQRLRGGLLLPYHLGRLTTYAALGALAATVGSTLSRLPWLGRLSGMLLLIAALLFLGQALRRLVPAIHRILPDTVAAPPWVVQLVARLTGRVDRSTRVGGLVLGLALGFLPCGFLYAALAAASAGGGPVAGALAMVAFGLGTVPGLIAVGIAGHAASRQWQRAVASAAPAVMLLNAVLLAVLGMRAIT